MTGKHAETMKSATPNEMIESGPVTLTMSGDPTLTHFGALEAHQEATT